MHLLSYRNALSSCVCLEWQLCMASSVPSYRLVTISDLLSGAKPQCNPDPEYWTKFAEKPEAPQAR
jgi:hypothetical protein